MKTLILLILIIQSGYRISYSQWFQQYPVTPYNHLYDIKFINNKTGWTCGNSGTIIRTTNGGKDWVRQNSQVTKTLYKIYPVDSEVVYCVGFFECILKTTNGGDKWTIVRNSTQQSPTFEAVFFLNRDTGWMSKNQYILKTINGCQTFDSTFVPDSFIFDIYFRNQNDGLFCGEGATMFRTTDGSNSWSQIPIVPKGQGLADLERMTFVNNNTGFTQGRTSNIVFKTTNFGLTWDSITEVIGADESYSIFFPNLNTGWCAGSYGNMFKTTNGGYNWIQENLSQFNTGFIHGLWFYNDSIGWAAGAATKILHTDNGGLTNVTKESNELPLKFSLHQNYPNPFNITTTIRFEIERKGNYKMELYNCVGQLVETIFEKQFDKGTYRLIYDAGMLSSGLYFYKLNGEGIIQGKKFILIK